MWLNERKKEGTNAVLSKREEFGKVEIPCSILQGPIVQKEAGGCATATIARTTMTIQRTTTTMTTTTMMTDAIVARRRMMRAPDTASVSSVSRLFLLYCCLCMTGTTLLTGVTAEFATGLGQSDNRDGQCGSTESSKCTEALRSFTHCSGLDQIELLVTSFDDFGNLDVFEECVHTFNNHLNDPSGTSALHCMDVLKDTISNPNGGDVVVNQIVSDVAQQIFYSAPNYCSCASIASRECPGCGMFSSFHTVLDKSAGLCDALDDIDCAAWAEFARPCQSNLEKEFGGTVDFTNDEQCVYVKESCGGVGALPAFRRLDCDSDESTVPADLWDFHNKFFLGCQSDDRKHYPRRTPAPSSSSYGQSPTAGPSHFHVPINNDDDDDDTNGNGSDDPDELPSSHFWRNMLILSVLSAIGWCGYKRVLRNGNDTGVVSFIQYRPLNVDWRNTSYFGFGARPSAPSMFEPPSLRPISLPTMTG